MKSHESCPSKNYDDRSEGEKRWINLGTYSGSRKYDLLVVGMCWFREATLKNDSNVLSRLTRKFMTSFTEITQEWKKNRIGFWKLI